MTSTSSRTIPFIIILVVAGMMAVDVFTSFELTEIHVSVIVSLMGTFGLGGVYIKGFKTAFAKFQKTKEVP